MRSSVAYGRILLAALVRTVVIAAIGWAVGWVFGALTGGNDANIGAGLAAMAAVALSVLAWAFLDGRAHGWWAIATWMIVGVLNGGAWALLAAWQARGLEAVPAGPDQPVTIPAPNPFIEFILNFAFFGIIPVGLAAFAILVGVLTRPTTRSGAVEDPVPAQG